jgi:hypothetical protein
MPRKGRGAIGTWVPQFGGIQFGLSEKQRKAESISHYLIWDAFLKRGRTKQPEFPTEFNKLLLIHYFLGGLTLRIITLRNILIPLVTIDNEYLCLCPKGLCLAKK